MVYWRCWFQTQIFEILTPKSIFGQIWAKKFKVVRFVWKLVYIVSHGCWFRIQTYIFEISTTKFIFGQIWALKSQNCSFCLKIGTHSISRMLILIPTLVFWISNPNCFGGANLGQKSQINWKLTHMVSRKCRFRIQT